MLILYIVKDVNILSDKEPNIDKLCKKNGEMLLEAISSDDDMIIDSEEGELVCYF